MRIYTRITQWLLIVLAALAIVIPAATHEVTELWPSDALEEYQVWDQPANIPTWDEFADEFPEGCRPKADDELADRLAVVDVHADAIVMDFDEAWARNTDEPDVKPAFGYQPMGANDVFVIGVCEAK